MRCIGGIHCYKVWKPMTEPAKYYYTVKVVYWITLVWGISAKTPKVLSIGTSPYPRNKSLRWGSKYRGHPLSSHRDGHKL